MSMTKIIISLIAAVALIGCEPTPRHHRHVKQQSTVREYHVQNSDGSWIFWYILLTNHSNNYYYYSSTVPVADFRSIPFTRSSDEKALPEEVQEQIGENEAISETELAAEEVPDAVDTTEAQMDAMTSEGGLSEGGSSDFSSSESGGGSSDAGGSDGGGGGE